MCGMFIYNIGENIITNPTQWEFKCEFLPVVINENMFFVVLYLFDVVKENAILLGAILLDKLVSDNSNFSFFVLG